MNTDTRLRAIITAPLQIQGGRLTHARTRRTIATGSHEVLRQVRDALDRIYRDHVMEASDTQLQRRISLARDTSLGGLARDFLIAEQIARQQLAEAEDHPLAGSDDRYTFAPVYIPDKLDSWDTWATATTLRSAMHGLARNPDRDITHQHGETVIGERLDLAVWPHEHTARLHRMDGSHYDRKLPAGTPYMGVEWTEEIWPSILARHIRGYSIEGKALHVASDGPDA